MKAVKKQIKDLEDGDIFYFKFTNDRLISENEHLLHDHVDLSGSDQIFIVDDCSDLHDSHNSCIYINGGAELYVKPSDTVFVLGHYSELIQLTENQ